MLDLLPHEIEEYCNEHTSPESELLYRINRETHLIELRPRMISGKIQGALLTMISRIIKPSYILEIGTFTGYATLSLVEGLQKGGSVDTIEIDVEKEERIRSYFAQSPYCESINLHIGNAVDIIPKLDKNWDLVFVDADKRDYITYYNLILPKMRKGAIMMVDNVLWSGKVVEELKANDKDTAAIIAFNDYVQKDNSVRNLLLPFRDGMMFFEKL